MIVGKLSLLLSFGFCLCISSVLSDPYFWLRDYYSTNAELIELFLPILKVAALMK